MFELIPFDRRSRRYFGVNPFQELEEMERRMRSPHPHGAMLRTDVRETASGYILDIDVPGFRKEEINVDVEGEYLTISVERKCENEDGDNSYIRRERVCGSFARSFDISGVNTDGIEVALENGVLTLTLPKQEEVKPSARRLEIK